MNGKKYAIGLVLLLLAMVGYHYYAASQAARQIDEALQGQSEDPAHAFSITYSDIDVHPFAGDIAFQDLSFSQEGLQSTASSLTFDMSYLDFLRFYIAGTDFGLKKLRNSTLTALQPSLELSPNERAITADTLRMEYSGQMYDLLRYSVGGYPLEQDHQLQAAFRITRLSQPETSWGDLAIDTLAMQAQIPAGNTGLLQTDRFTASANSITWIPPQAFASQYEFFIRGFGYEPDSIAVDSLNLQLSAGERSQVKRMTADLHMDLFHLNATADLIINGRSVRHSAFRNGTISAPELSRQFETFLKNSEQLLGISIPDGKRNLLQFSGPVTNPDISFGGSQSAN